MKKLIGVIFALAIIFQGCSSTEVYLHGFYQSEMINSYTIQISFDQEKNEFIEYIDNRKVNSGKFEITKENTYNLIGYKKEFSITLDEDDTFNIIINQINGDESIHLINLGKTPTGFGTHIFDDVDEYESLLD